MIPETNGTMAVFTGEPGKRDSYRAVIGWDDDGVALVIDRKSGRLCRVDEMPDRKFHSIAQFGLEDDPRPTDPVTRLADGGGWMATWKDGDTTPVLFWAVCRDGEVRPFIHYDGSVETSGDPSVGRFKVTHPDEHIED